MKFREGRLRLPSWIKIGVASIALAAPLALVGATPAQAGALGCSWWGATTIKGVPVAAGQYCVTIEGSGTFVAGVQGGYTSPSSLCYTNITAEFFDRNWQWYRTDSSPQQYGCSRARTQYIYTARYVKPGFVCSTLKSGSVRVTSRCFGIF